MREECAESEKKVRVLEAQLMELNHLLDSSRDEINLLAQEVR